MSVRRCCHVVTSSDQRDAVLTKDRDTTPRYGTRHRVFLFFGFLMIYSFIFVDNLPRLSHAGWRLNARLSDRLDAVR